MSPGRVLQRQGDVVHDVTCTEVRIPLREMEQCFREILVQHEDHRFTDPTTRVLVMTVSQSDIPKPHYTAPVAMDHVWDQVNCVKQYRRRRAAVNGARPVPTEEIPLQ